MNEQIADVLTKNLSFDKLKGFREKLGLYLNDTKINLNKSIHTNHHTPDELVLEKQINQLLSLPSIYLTF
jgi:hypothetical protein